MNRGERAILWVLVSSAILVSGLVVTAARLSVEGGRAMDESDREFDQGHLRESLQLARRAASLHAPGLKHIQRADARLDAIAIGAEAAQRTDVAVLAWQAIRATELERTWVGERPTDRARRADRRLAELLVDDGRHGTLSEQQQHVRRVLADLESSHRTFAKRYLLRASACCVMAMGVLAVYWGLGAQPVRSRSLCLGIGLVGLGAVAWAILLSLA